jgi:hypothetical protein
VRCGLARADWGSITTIETRWPSTCPERTCVVAHRVDRAADAGTLSLVGSLIVAVYAMRCGTSHQERGCTPCACPQAEVLCHVIPSFRICREESAHPDAPHPAGGSSWNAVRCSTRFNAGKLRAFASARVSGLISSGLFSSMMLLLEWPIRGQPVVLSSIRDGTVDA